MGQSYSHTHTAALLRMLLWDSNIILIEYRRLLRRSKTLLLDACYTQAITPICTLKNKQTETERRQRGRNRWGRSSQVCWVWWIPFCYLESTKVQTDNLPSLKGISYNGSSDVYMIVCVCVCVCERERASECVFVTENFIWQVLFEQLGRNKKLIIIRTINERALLLRRRLRREDLLEGKMCICVSCVMCHADSRQFTRK